MRDHEYNELISQRHAIQVQMAERRGEMTAALKNVKHDPSVVEALRARQWHRAGYRGIRVVGDEIQAIPEGWPEGVDGEEVVAEWIHVRVEKLRKSSDEEVSASPYRKPGPLESKLGELLEGDTAI